MVKWPNISGKKEIESMFIVPFVVCECGISLDARNRQKFFIAGTRGMK